MAYTSHGFRTAQPPGAAELRREYVNILILNAPAAGDYFHDTTDVATNVTDPRRRETVFEVPANILFLAQVDNLQIVFVVAAFEIMLASRRRPIQLSLQRR
jgi:hypothetical protein